MLLHHLNCGSFRPRLAPPVVCHVLLVERPGGLLLVDTGLGTDDLADPKRLGGPFVAMMRPTLSPGETALAQVKALGHSPEDVSDIVLTHLDLDHAGGLSDFPNARVHVFEKEYDAATRPALRERARYIAGQWAHGPQWVKHSEPGDDWRGFPAVAAIDDDVLLIPLPGHTRGHCGVAVRDPSGHWLLHAGDSFFDGNQILTPASCNRSLAAFQVLMAADNKARRQNVARLQELVVAGSSDLTVFCAHDKAQYDALVAAR